MRAALQKVRVPARQKMRSYNKDDVNDSETWKCNFVFLWSFLDYSKLLELKKKYLLIILELNW